MDLVRDHATGLLFPAGDSRRLADAVHELAIRPELRVALAEHGATAARSLTVERMVDGVETVLEGVIPPRK